MITNQKKVKGGNVEEILIRLFSVVVVIFTSYFIVKSMKNQTKIIVEGELIEVSDYLESLDNKSQES